MDGEFWHGQNWEERKPKLKRNREYWIAKIEENIARDIRNDKDLREGLVCNPLLGEGSVERYGGCIDTIREFVEQRIEETIID